MYACISLAAILIGQCDTILKNYFFGSVDARSFKPSVVRPCKCWVLISSAVLLPRFSHERNTFRISWIIDVIFVMQKT